MREVLLAERKAAVLTPSQLACLSAMPTVNLTAGCAHECLYCYARSYSQNPGAGRVTLYANTLAKLRSELPRKRRPPRAVYFSPSCDPFQPLAEVLDLTHDVFAFLLEHAVGVAFLTKGLIPGRHMELLTAHAQNVHGGIGLTTLKEDVWQVFEPRTAPPQRRVAQIAALIRADIDTQVRLDPILPGVTDDEASLDNVLTALAEAGVCDVAISTAFLRPPIIQTLRRHIHRRSWLQALLHHYEGGRALTMHGAGTKVLVPPAATRRAIYERVERIAIRHGIRVRICACKNGDVAEGSCHITGDWNDKPTARQQGMLFG